MAQVPIAVQLYSLREETSKDFLGTLRKVAEIGYAGVEFAGFGGLSATEMKTALDDLNLRAAGAHIGVEQLEANASTLIPYLTTIECAYVAIPYMPALEDVAGARALADRLNTLGQTYKARGIQLCYHNHAHEFASIEGTPGLDLMFQLTDPALLQTELDLYWVAKAGHDPVAYVTKYADREPVIHVKDMSPDGEYAEVGHGVIPWPEVFAATRGVAWYIVEQDVCKRPCLESIAISLNYLRGLGLA